MSGWELPLGIRKCLMSLGRSALRSPLRALLSLGSAMLEIRGRRCLMRLTLPVGVVDSEVGSLTANIRSEMRAWITTKRCREVLRLGSDAHAASVRSHHHPALPEPEVDVGQVEVDRRVRPGNACGRVLASVVDVGHSCGRPGRSATGHPASGPQRHVWRRRTASTRTRTRVLWRPSEPVAPKSRMWGSGTVGLVVEGDVVAVGVGEGERASEWAVDRFGHDGLAVGGECVVDVLDVGGLKP